MSLRIAQVCPYFHPHVGGVESHVLELSRELQRRGHEVAVVTSNSNGAAPREEYLGIPVVRVKPLVTWFASPVAPGITRALGVLPHDVVHAHSPPPLSSYYASRATRRSGKPIVVTYHCDLELPRAVGILATALYRRTLEATTLARAARVIVTSRTYAATSRTAWRQNPQVIPMAVDARWFNPKVEPGDVRTRYGLGPGPMVLFVGRLVRHKGIENFLEAARLVPEAQWVVVGDGPWRRRLGDYAQAVGASNVRFLGRVPQGDLPRIYATSELLVLPSVSRLEAFGTVALEAMASGRPVVLSDIPGVREVITHDTEGLLFEPLNAEDLGRKVRALLEDEEKRRHMGAEGRHKVEEIYSMERVAAQVEQVYRDVLEGPAATPR